MNDFFEIKVYEGNEEKILTAQKGERLHSVLQLHGVHVNAVCNGKGLCGKCKLKLHEKLPLTENEKRFLTEEEVEAGIHMACEVEVSGSLQVTLPQKKSATIVTKGRKMDFAIDSIVQKTVVSLKTPTLGDPTDDRERLLQALPHQNYKMSLSLIRSLPTLLRENNYAVAVYHDEEEILQVTGRDTVEAMYGVAVDIGTTTVVCYLLNLSTGEVVDTIAALNEQRSFGSDVISRIQHTLEAEDGLDELHARIVKQLKHMIERVCQRQHISTTRILGVNLAGNTTMLHLAAGLPVRHLSAAPFIATAKGKMSFRASEYGFSLPFAKVYHLPAVGSYVGADIVAAVIASGMAEDKENLFLLIDIGTNGEIALGNGEKILCCSTAAGPAFEGANISHGMGGVEGAISAVKLQEGDIILTTIGNQKPIGICGSGIIDAIAQMLEAGIVDETGRLVDVDEIAVEAYAKRLQEDDHGNVFMLTDDVGITAKDVREVQLAKAAIAAGIEVLLREMKVEKEAITTLYIAGGFGSFVNQHSAAAIGLLPKELLAKTVVIGNGAGTGATVSLLSKKHCRLADEIVRKASYIELSAMPIFQDFYVEQMMFE